MTEQDSTQQERRPPKTSGSLEPIPGRCARRLPRAHPDDPWRYCKKFPLKGKTCCARCGGRTGTGVANTNFRHGRNIKSKYGSVVPDSMVHLLEKLSSVPIEKIASSREEITLLDARTAQILDQTRKLNPTQINHESTRLLNQLQRDIDGGDKDGARLTLGRLRKLSRETSVLATNWAEIRENLNTRDKLAKTELAYQKLMSEKVLLEQIETFIRALVLEARALTDDRQRLQQYSDRVIELGKSVALPMLLANNVRSDEEEEG